MTQSDSHTSRTVSHFIASHAAWAERPFSVCCLAFEKVRLAPAQERSLADILDSGPVAYGFLSGVWTSSMIARLIREEFGITYHPGHVRRLLHKIGFSVQRPRRKLARASRYKQDRWHRYTYPNLKKTPQRKGRH